MRRSLQHGQDERPRNLHPGYRQPWRRRRARRLLAGLWSALLAISLPLAGCEVKRVEMQAEIFVEPETIAPSDPMLTVMVAVRMGDTPAAGVPVAFGLRLHFTVGYVDFPELDPIYTGAMGMAGISLDLQMLRSAIEADGMMEMWTGIEAICVVDGKMVLTADVPVLGAAGQGATSRRSPASLTLGPLPRPRRALVDGP